jgi:hypothetical protein
VARAVKSVGDNGLYQKLLGVLLFLMAAEVNFLIFGPTFIFMNPKFNCSFVSEQVDESVACPRIS